MNEKLVIAVDAMGGENSPDKILEAISNVVVNDDQLFFNIFGDVNLIKTKLLKYKIPNNRYEVFNAEENITDDESPLQAAKKGNKSSMWQSIESVKNNKSHIALSAGNTGAMLILSKMILSMIEGIDKPALAGLWPNKKGMNVVLDLGANIECNQKNLVDFSLMGASLYKSLFPEDNPKVAILNVGSEEIKGHDTVKEAYQLLKNKKTEDFEFKGYVEGNNMVSGNVNVIVTDGFTGNVALKTAEGTADLVTSTLKKSLNSNIYSKILTFLNYINFKKFKDTLDPRKYNGAIFLGLNGPVVKSHGSTDSLGFAHSIKMCKNIIINNLMEKIKKNLN